MYYIWEVRKIIDQEERETHLHVFELWLLSVGLVCDDAGFKAVEMG